MPKLQVEAIKKWDNVVFFCSLHIPQLSYEVENVVLDRPKYTYQYRGIHFTLFLQGDICNYQLLAEDVDRDVHKKIGFSLQVTSRAEVQSSSKREHS